jgi:RNA recognition motif-containing protein
VESLLLHSFRSSELRQLSEALPLRSPVKFGLKLSSNGSLDDRRRRESDKGSNVKNIFVGNLSSNLTPHELRTLFQDYGAVKEIEIVTDVDTRYSRGFAFVEMTNDLEAMKAIADLNGRTVWGKPLKVEEAGPKLQAGKSAGI